MPRFAGPEQESAYFDGVATELLGEGQPLWVRLEGISGENRRWLACALYAYQEKAGLTPGERNHAGAVERLIGRASQHRTNPGEADAVFEREVLEVSGLMSALLCAGLSTPSSDQQDTLRGYYRMPEVGRQVERPLDEGILRDVLVPALEAAVAEQARFWIHAEGEEPVYEPIERVRVVAAYLQTWIGENVPFARANPEGPYYQGFRYGERVRSTLEKTDNREIRLGYLMNRAEVVGMARPKPAQLVGTPEPQSPEPQGLESTGSELRGLESRGPELRGPEPRGSELRGLESEGREAESPEPRGREPRGPEPKGRGPESPEPRGPDRRGPEAGPEIAGTAETTLEVAAEDVTLEVVTPEVVGTPESADAPFVRAGYVGSNPEHVAALRRILGEWLDADTERANRIGALYLRTASHGTEEGMISLQPFAPTRAWSGELPADQVRAFWRWRTLNTMVHEFMHRLTHPAFAAKAATIGHSQIIAEGIVELVAHRIFLSLVRESFKSPEVRLSLLGDIPADSRPDKGTLRVGYGTAGVRAAQISETVGMDNVHAAFFLGRTDLIGL
ncbi:hypothetical protein [Acrocarpospora phusangensis]|uniref:hypothetical protein n=1 Tax=Acrocarpospora phusangensis TaxID=1070424 RepID=UPI00194F33C5|nr:hypothetical protein [Acrocarpospora phusangensis]